MKRYNLSRTRLFEMLALIPDIDIRSAGYVFVDAWLTSEQYTIITEKFGYDACREEKYEI